MKTLCTILCILSAASLLLLLLSLFDIVGFSDTLHGIVGLAAVVCLALFIKLYIRLYKSTRRH